MTKIIRGFSFLCVVFVMLLASFPVSAFSYEGQSYVLDDSGKSRIPIPQPYVAIEMIGNIGGEYPYLSNPQDLFVTDDGTLYVCDTGNNRVVKLVDGKMVAEYTTADDIMYYQPTGVYYDSYGHLFIADTGNARIVHLDEKGEFVESFVKPDSELLYETELFEPNKVAVGENTGNLYLLQGKHFLTMDAHNEFKGYIGTLNVGFDLRNFLYRLFASDIQKAQVGKAEPSPYNNFHLHEDGLLYAVSNEKANQIRVINTVGQNIYPDGFYGEMSYEEDGTAQYPEFVDIAVGDGFVTIAEKNTSCLYQYDSEGNLLATFGGKGNLLGQFDVISSIAMDKNGNLYVVDSSRNNIQILQPTYMITLVQEANRLYLAGEYDKSMDKWQDVMKVASNYPLVRKSIGKIEYKRKNYEAAKDSFFAANDRVNYGTAFEKSRYLMLQENFAWIVLGLAATVVLLVFALTYFRRKALHYENDLYGIERKKTPR